MLHDERLELGFWVRGDKVRYIEGRCNVEKGMGIGTGCDGMVGRVDHKMNVVSRRVGERDRNIVRNT